MKIRVHTNTNKTMFRFYTEDNKMICVAFKPASAKSANTYFHKDLSPIFAKVEGAALKPDIKENPDDYEYRMLIKPADKQTHLEAIKAVLKANLEDAQFVTIANMPGKKKPAAKKANSTPAKKAPAKKAKEDKVKFVRIENGKPVNA